MVVYQVYPRSFADSGGDGLGDLAGITAQLDHLAWLGVDALWLSPINPSPMADGGYDVADYRGVDPAFGTVEDVERLAAEARAAASTLLLDVVPCHTSIEHPWFRERPELYVWSPVDGPPNNWRANFGGPAWREDPHGRGWYLHSFYPEQPDLDWRNPEVAAELAGVLAFWRVEGRRGLPPRRDPAAAEGPRAPRRPARHAPAPAGAATRTTRRSSTALLRPARRGGAARARCGRAPATTRSSSGRSGCRPAATALPRAPRRELLLRALLRGLERRGAGRRASAAGSRTGSPAWVLSNHDFPRLADRIGRENVAAAALLLLSLPGAVFLFQGDELALEQRAGAAAAPSRPTTAPAATRSATRCRGARPGPTTASPTRPAVARGRHCRPRARSSASAPTPSSPLARTRA